MRHSNSIPRLSRFTAIAAASIALLSAGSAMAVENLYVGGATFPAVPYVGNAYLTPNPDARLSTNAGNTAGTGYTVGTITSGSIFGTYSSGSTNKVSYCQTGSGFGKNVLNGSASSPANGQCKDFSTTPAGFSAPNATADAIGTDSPYSTADYNAFLGSSLAAARTGIVQIPTIAGAIALPHTTAAGGLVDKYNLTTAAVCQIYSSKVTTWAQVNTLLGTNSGSTGTIKIVYRTDGSGTTFAFTSYLAAKCNGTADVPSGFVFSPNQSFDAALPGGVAGVFGARAVGASGNAGVVTTSKSTADAQGYADVGEVLAQTAEYDFVNTYDPAKFGLNSSGVATPISINPTTGLLTGKVLDGATVNNVPGSGSATVKNCVRLVSPTAVISSTYPIAAITYLAGYYGGNGSVSHIQAIKDLYGIYYNTSTRPALPTGFAYLDGVATFRTSVQSTISSCVN